MGVSIEGGSEDTQKAFEIHGAVLQALPKGVKLVSAEESGSSAWSNTARLTVVLDDGSAAKYFLKCMSGEGARSMAEGQYRSAQAASAAVPSFCPKPICWGQYTAAHEQTYFYIEEFCDMDLSAAPDPAQLAKKIAGLHEKGISPNGMFGFDVPTAIGKLKRTTRWEKSWAASYTGQLQDVQKYDRQTNGTWLKLDEALEQLYEGVIPRLLGALQSDGREISPVLVHGDLWEKNVGIDMESGDIVIFDLGCTYAHNEFEFGTWRCSWTFQFNTPAYLKHYQRLIEPSEPAEEWDDRNRLYSLWPYLIDSAGHAGSESRRLAYNDVLFLCEKYAPLDALDSYDPEKDIVATGGIITS